MIDMDFHHIISDRLDRIRNHLEMDPDVIADRILQGRFERIKCSYGSVATSTIPTIPLPVPGLKLGYYNPDEKIEGSTLMITRYGGPTQLKPQ